MRPSRRSPWAAAAGLLAALPSGHGLRTWQPIKELQKQVQGHPSTVASLQFNDLEDYPQFPAYNLTGVPVDHFHNDSLYEPHVNDTFNLRYWFDAQHYKPGGPVIVLAAGETSGANRLPFLHKGIAAQLAQATGGVAVILEHRYYGTSFPYDNLTTPSLRFLRTEQALADTAYFAEHVRFSVGDKELDLSPSSGNAPWVVYGGSYAGVFAALLRVLYPDVFWGAISSSGVTVAIYDYWQYYEAHRLYGPPSCVNLTQTLIHVADQILLAGRMEQAAVATAAAGHQQSYDLQQSQQLFDPAQPPAARVAALKAAFGLGNVTHDDDFAAILSDAMGGWQETNWDPAENSPAFGHYCANVTSPKLLYPDVADRTEDVKALLAATTYRNDMDALTIPLLNFIGWVNVTHRCDGDPGKDDKIKHRTQDACFSNRNSTFYKQDDLHQRWRSWTYQYCTQWGYLSTGSGVPQDQRPLISRLLDLEYLSIPCREAFNLTTLPDLESVNKYGGFDISYPRLAIVDGEADPWRAATPHALVGGKDRESTTDQPFLLIEGGAVHHWDEYGLLPNETTADLPPAPVRLVQADEAAFVLAWVAEWAKQKRDAEDTE